MRGRLRVLAGRRELPTAGCVDSQTARATETVGAAACGYDAGKKLKGQKRHVVVDTLGLLLCVIVTAASVQDPRRRASGPGAAAREVLHHHAGLG
ncbi:transposase [Nonomuraea sp. WAC 01424]|uniref:transposase n=1 Tax=Nonomuraea sp. WAC 01424 TaxID=2203200 RepID=UPI00163B9448